METPFAPASLELIRLDVTRGLGAAEAVWRRAALCRLAALTASEDWGSLPPELLLKVLQVLKVLPVHDGLGWQREASRAVRLAGVSQLEGGYNGICVKQRVKLKARISVKPLC
jgi:hypothetical protein